MRRTASEKMEIIHLVEGTDLPVRATLRQLGVPRRPRWGHSGAKQQGRGATARTWIGRFALIPKPLFWVPGAVWAISVRPAHPLCLHRSPKPEADTTTLYHSPTFSIDDQGSWGGSAFPFCSNSIEIWSGDRTKAMWPSRGGRLIWTPESIRR